MNFKELEAKIKNAQQ